MNDGFFDLKTGDTPDSIRKRSYSKKQGCDACGLYRECKSPKMSPTGKGSLKILIVGEAPGKTEDLEGVPFVGSSGRLLEETMDELGVKLRRDCRITNAVCCKLGDKKPSELQINECRSRVLKEIAEFKPQVIIPMGKYAIQSVIGHKVFGRLTKIKDGAYFSEQIPDQDYKAWICPVYHPAHLLYNENDIVLKKKWEEDLKKAIELAQNGTKIPKISLKNKVSITDNIETACKWLHDLLKKPRVTAFDYETTGIKPHADGHRIECVSIAFEGHAYAFPFFKDQNFRDLWKQVLTNKAIGKIAHKSDFESIWTCARAGGYWPDPIYWDTCVVAHCLDNKKPTGLKFLSYVKFGIIGYDEDMDPFITGVRGGEDKKSANHRNRIHEAPMKKKLLYCGYDSYIAWKLQKQQREILLNDSHKYKGWELFMEALHVFPKIHQQGMRVDMEQMNLQMDRAQKRLDILSDKIQKSEEVQKWKDPKAFNPSSDTQLAKLLYELLNYEKPDGSGGDEEALNRIGSEFTSNVIQYRKWGKIRNTYLAQYKREQVNGILRPFFNLHKVDTFRSSSDSPNFQNVPKRNKLAMRIVRSTIRPSPGNRLIEYDYKGIEVSIGACYHKDPAMIEYIVDPSTDMHRDVAMELFLKKEVTPQERYVGKNGFVFPAFYGSTARPEKGKKVGKITRDIWEAMEDHTRVHVRNQGIETIQDFQSHVEEIEENFWGERFSVYSKWKRKTYQKYEQKGYVDLYTGFRCYGPMKYTEVTNYPIQGSAFHCLLWTLIQVHDKICAISGRSSIIGQIHDAIVGDIHPEDEEEVDRIVQLWGTKKIREHWEWILVPLTIEKERSAVDGSWDEMEEV